MRLQLTSLALVLAACESTCPPGLGLTADGTCAPLAFLGDDTDPSETDVVADATTHVGDVSLYTAEGVERFCAEWQRVFGDVLLSGEGITDDVTVDCLVGVDGVLTVSDTAWTRWHLPALVSVGQQLDVGGNAALASLDVQTPLQIGGRLVLAANPEVDALDLSQVTLLGGLSITDMDGLAEVVVAQEEPVRGDLTLSGNDALERVDLSGVAFEASQVRISSLPLLTELDLRGLRGDVRYLNVANVPSVAAIDLSGLDGEIETATFSSVATLVDLDLSGVTSLGAFSVDGSTEDLRLDLGGLATLSAGLSLPRRLAAFTLGPVEDVPGDLVVQDTRLADLGALAGIRTVAGDLVLQSNGQLTDVGGLEGVVSVGEDLLVLNNGSLTAEAAQALADAIGEDRIGGDVALYGNGS